MSYLARGPVKTGIDSKASRAGRRQRDAKHSCHGTEAVR